MGIGITGAISVALITAAISFFTQLFFKRYDYKKNALSFELSVIAEIEAMLNIIEKRKYREALESGIFSCQLSLLNNGVVVQVQDNYCPIYYNNLDKISLIRASKVKDIVQFYSILTSLIQDMKPGGVLNTAPNLEIFQECLTLLDEAISLGKKIIN